jgi:hypothetical protein
VGGWGVRSMPLLHMATVAAFQACRVLVPSVLVNVWPSLAKFLGQVESGLLTMMWLMQATCTVR